jgi:hypothetical protein
MHTLNTCIHKHYPHHQHNINQVKTLENGITYYDRSEIICKKQLKIVGESKSGEKVSGKLHPNYLYKIVGQTNKVFTLEDTLDFTRFKVSHQSIATNFILPYVNTVHSAQGDCIGEKFVIADWKAWCVDLEWLYTAITRCKKLSDIYFLEQTLTTINIDTVINDMIAGYIYQDKKKKIYTSSDNYKFLPTWIKSQYYDGNRRCCKCNSYMTFEKSNEHKVTVDRLNNLVGHDSESNLQLMCKCCNCEKSNK